MATKDPRVDAYIDKSASFAKPILKHIRSLVHKACPDVKETMKWSFPHFDYKDEMMCSMAAFKEHCSFGFWKAPLMKDKALMETARSETAMGHLGKIMKLDDLPSDKKLMAYVKEAMDLNDKGLKVKKAAPTKKKEIEVPDYFTKALKKVPKAFKAFEGFSYSHRKEYIEWITEAKTEATREKRMTQAIEWLAEGKPRNWKYM